MDDAVEEWELRAAAEPPLSDFERPQQRLGDAAARAAPLGWLQQAPPESRTPGGGRSPGAAASPQAQRRSPLRWEQLQLLGARDAEEDERDGAYAAEEEEEVSVASTPSVASRQRAVAAWVETTSPLMQPRLRRSGDGGSSGGGARGEWAAEEDAWERDGDAQQRRRSRSAAASPSTSGRPWQQRSSGSDAYGAPLLRPSPSRSERPHERGAAPLRRDGGGDATTAAALGRLMDDMADVKRALLTQSAAEPATWQAAQQQQQQPFVRASPDRPAVLPPDAWLGSPSPHGGTPRRRVSGSSSVGRAATPRTSSGSRRAALWQQLEATDDDTPSPEEQPGAAAWRAGGAHDSDDAFSFHADRSRPPSPELWRPPGASSPAQAAAAAAAAAAVRARLPRAARVERAASEWSDAEHSAPSEMESEMDSFRVGARRALAPPRHAAHAAAAAAAAAAHAAAAASGSPPEQSLAPEWWRETIPEEEAFEGVEPGTVLWEQRRAALAERCGTSHQRSDALAHLTTCRRFPHANRALSPRRCAAQARGGAGAGAGGRGGRGGGGWVGARSARGAHCGSGGGGRCRQGGGCRRRLTRRRRAAVRGLHAPPPHARRAGAHALALSDACARVATSLFSSPVPDGCFASLAPLISHPAA
jgi:hypothetical protein